MMIKRLIDNFGSTVYVQIWEDRVRVVDVVTSEYFDETPLVAIETNDKGQKIIVGVGDAVKSLSTDSRREILNPFQHPRALINDFVVAEKVLQHTFQLVLGKKFISPAPRVVVHPMDKLEGGLTMIEMKALRELALGAGARDVELYEGPELSASSFSYEDIQKANSKSEQKDPTLKPSKENYWHLAFWVILLLVIFWVSNSSTS